MTINAENILKNAESKLKTDPNSSEQDHVNLFKKFLKIETQRLLMSHRSGADGLQIIKDRSDLMDVLIQHIFEFVQKQNPLQKISSSPCSIVALGGYGRQELNPYSDIDLLFLIKKKVDLDQDPLIKKILYLLWDLGFKVGQAVRTIPETIEEGKKDFKSRTAMMEARFLLGDRLHFEEFQKAFQQECLCKNVSSYVAQKLDEIKTRHEKYKNTVYLQEPHIKEGVGGLRDLASILWLYRSVHGFKSFEEMAQKNIISKDDLKIIHRTFSFLHRVRNELHFSMGKCFDILSLPLQAKAAKELGYQDTPVSKASEIFMKDYYLHARNVEQMLKVLLSRNEIQTQLKMHFPRKFVVRHGFSFTDEEISPGKDPSLFLENPFKLFEVFLYCVQGNYRLNPALTQQIREHLYLVTREIQISPQARDIFISLMGHESSIIESLRAMHETGLLGKYLPEFGKATCFVQHDFYHKYTLDEHTLKAVGFLDELKTTKDPKLEGYSKLLKEVQHRDVVFLSVFLHDIGKVEGRDHSIKGVKVADEIFKRIQYDPEKAEWIKFQIENHLIMAHLSQRRDLSEEKVIIDFAKKMEHVENLRILHLLTYADSRATGEEMWNEWKEALLWELYYKTKRYLEEKVVLLPSEVEAIKDSYTEIISKKNIALDKIKNHLDMLPVAYLQSYRPETISQHLDTIEKLKLKDPQVLWDYHEKTNTTELTVCTKDRIGLFAEIAGTLASQEANILSANIFTRKDGIVLDKFSLENRYEKSLLDARTRAKVEQGLMDIIHGKTTVQKLLKERKLSQTSCPRNPSVITFDNEGSLGATIFEIQADDKIGFLYEVTRTFSKLGLNIHLAKIATEKNQAYDVFYITDCDGRKIDRLDVQKVISEEIEKALLSPLTTI